MTFIELIIFLFIQYIVIFLAVTGYIYAGWLGASVLGIAGWGVIYVVIRWTDKEFKMTREMIWFLLAQCVIISYAVFGYNQSGWANAYLSATVGLIATLLVALWFKERFDWIFEALPECECGVLESAMRIEPDTKEDIVRVCACGRRYVRVGEKFLEVLPEGLLRPYLKKKGRGWVADDYSPFNPTSEPTSNS